MLDIFFLFCSTGQKNIAELRHFYFRLHDRVFSANPQVDRGKELQAMISEVLGDPSTPGENVYMDKVKEPRYGGPQYIPYRQKI